MTIRTGLLAGLIFVLMAACNSSGGGGGVGDGGILITPGPVLKCAVARTVATSADLVPGPVARGTLGDFVIENDKLRAIVQKGGRNWGHINQFGGNLIDALPKNSSGAMLGRDHFEEFVLGTNIESAPNYQTVEVVEAGGEDADGNCKPAVIKVTGPDDLLDFVNGSSAIRGLSLQGVPLQFPPSADDKDLPVRIETTYTLDAGKTYVRIDTKLINESSTAQNIYLTEYVNGSGEVELFQHGYGFGEPFATAPCNVNRCDFMAYAGHEGGSGVSYGLIHKQAGSSSVSVSGVSVFLYGRDVVDVATTPEQTQPATPATPVPPPSGSAGTPNFTVPASGELLITRYFAVGTGTVASIIDARNEIHALVVGRVEGTVTDLQGPVAGAEIAMISSGRDGFEQNRGPTINVVNHFRTDAAGRYGGSFPPGSYTLQLNMPGRLAGTPATASITIAADATVTQEFTLQAASHIRVLVKDVAGKPIPAKVVLVGSRLGPDGGEPLNSDTLIQGNALSIFTGVYGDSGADPLPPGTALIEFAVLDSGSGAVALGDTGSHPIEPGTYQVSVSHGPRYNEFTQDVTVTAGAVTTVNAVLAEVVPTPGYVFGDFHVHSFDSPDSEVTNRERMATYVAEGMDFFTPSDHEMRVDFSPVIADMGLGSLIGTAPSAETTSFDYGHFNFWPVGIESDTPDSELRNEGHSRDPKTGRGAVDWGGQAPLGKDFPSAGHFSRTPQEIFDAAEQDPLHDGRQVVRQINHIYSHFGNSGGSGLGINTGVSPPASSVAGTARRLNPAYDNPDFDTPAINYYSDRYDALEVWIGTDGRNGQRAAFIGEAGENSSGAATTAAGGNLGDWFNLLNQGRRKTGVSNSDTHERRLTSLHTRNVISARAPLVDAQGRPEPSSLAADPHTVGDAIRAGYTTMTNAPFLVVKAANAVGAVAGLEQTDAFGVAARPLPLASPTEAVTLTVDVKSPLWAQYNQILVFTNASTSNVSSGTPPAPTNRYRVCAPPVAQRLNLPADFDRAEMTVADTGGAKRYETSKTLSLTGPAKDYWIVVMVRGTDGVSVPMWPVVPDSFKNAGTLTDRSTADLGVQALAVSNPIFVDADNDGKWTPPGVAAGSCPNGNMPAT